MPVDGCMWSVHFDFVRLIWSLLFLFTYTDLLMLNKQARVCTLARVMPIHCVESAKTQTGQR